MKIRALILSVVVGVLVSSTAYSQTFTGTIRGIVRDTTDAVLPGVTINIRNVATEITRSVITDETGNYNVPFLSPGTYEVTAELTGFKKEVRSAVKLEVNQQLALNFTLSVGQVTESITVEAAAITIETETSSIQKTVDEKKIVELPLNGRNFLELNLLVPGVAPPLKGTQLQTQGGAINANGLREASNFFWLDGMDNTTSIIGQYVIKPPIDTVKEFKVQTSSYSAEFGRTAGAQMNVVTKSGTNEFHGNVYEFVRNNIFDASNFFDDKTRTEPPFRRNQFGFTAGGPILRDRMFFFGSYEGTRSRQQITRTVRVPDPRWIRGDFSSLLPGTVIRDPLTGTPFPGNIIPTARQNPIGAGLAAFYPAPNLPSPLQNYLSLGNQSDTFDAVFGRIDHKFSDNDTLFGRYNYERQDSTYPLNLFATHTLLPGWGRIQQQTFQVLGLSETHIFSPTVINELRAAYNQWPLGYKHQDQGSEVAFRLGVGGLQRDPIDMGFPQVAVVGFEPMGSSGNLPQGGPFETYVIADTFSLTRAGHATKIGADYHRFHGNFFLNSLTRGRFVFTGQFSGHSVADLILGYPLQAVRGIGTTDLLQTQNSISFFFQDDWKVRPNFTVNFGLRYEINQPTKERRDRLTNFDFEKGTFFTAADRSYPKGTINADKNNFAPRIGFAWDPFKTGKTSVRAGYGVFYDIAIGNVPLNLRINPPLFQQPFIASDPTRPTLNMATVFLQVPGQQAPPGIIAQNRNFRDGYVQKWSLNVQYQLRPDILADVGYMGTKGTHLTWQVNRNQPLPGPGPIQPRRPYPAFANINMWDSNGDSIYHSLQASLEKRFIGGLSFLAAYTFSKSIDLASTYFSSGNANNRAQNNYNLRAERGLSDFDVRNRFVFSYNYELPWGKGRRFLADLSGPANVFLGGWQVNGITSVQSGTPFTPVLSRDNSNTGWFFDRPNLVGDWRVSDPKPERWVNPDAFRVAPPFTFGNAGRGILTGPGTINFDFSIFKDFNFAEERRLQFRAEFFNLFNTPSFDIPNRFADTPLFGRVFSAGFARQIQFALKLSF